MNVAHFWSFDAQGFGVTIDAFTAGSLGVDGLVEGAGTIQRDAHDATGLDIAIFDTAFAFFELFMVAVSARALRMQEWARIGLGTIAVGMLKREFGVHASSFGAQGNAIGIALKGGMPMLIEGNGSNATVTSHIIIDATSHHKQHRQYYGWESG
jgi:hypothetical protein